MLETCNVLCGRLRGRVNGIIGEVDKEGLRFLFLDKRHRLFGQPGRQVTRVLDFLAVAIHGPDVGILLREIEVVVRAAAEKTIPMIESTTDRALLDGEPEVPLAVGGGSVARGLEETREDFFGLRHPAPTFAGRVDAGALLVTAGEQTRAGGRAHVAGDIALAEPHALVCEGVHMRGRDLFGVKGIETDIGVTLVVTDDHDDIWRPWCGVLTGQWCEQTRAKENARKSEAGGFH